MSSTLADQYSRALVYEPKYGGRRGGGGCWVSAKDHGGWAVPVLEWEHAVSMVQRRHGYPIVQAWPAMHRLSDDVWLSTNAVS
jgi:hypothetical protein